jgi:hypothetical protein
VAPIRLGYPLIPFWRPKALRHNEVGPRPEEEVVQLLQALGDAGPASPMLLRHIGLRTRHVPCVFPTRATFRIKLEDAVDVG